MPRTPIPAAISRAMRRVPMNPVAPVTRTFMSGACIRLLVARLVVAQVQVLVADLQLLRQPRLQLRVLDGSEGKLVALPGSHELEHPDALLRHPPQQPVQRAARHRESLQRKAIGVAIKEGV